MSETKLPPGPWRARYTVPDGGSPDDLYYPAVDSLVDANDSEILGMMHEDGGQIIVPPEVLRAIEAIPEMLKVVEAARGALLMLGRIHGGIVEGLDHGLRCDEIGHQWDVLRDALAQIDDVDRPHP